MNLAAIKRDLSSLINIRNREEAFFFLEENYSLIEEGSSRVVYRLSPDLVIKVAKLLPRISEAKFSDLGKKHRRIIGILQNRQEVLISSDCLSLNLVAKTYLHHPKYHWIVSEYCEPFFAAYEEFYEHISKRMLCKMDGLVDKYGIDDIGPGNVGKNKKGRLVLIDYGMTRETEKYYGNNPFT